MSVVQLIDKNGNQLEFDSEYIVNVGVEHHHIHEGLHYTAQDYDASVDISTPKEWLLLTGAAPIYAHLVFIVRASKSGLIELFEGTEASANGAHIDCYNNDRNSTNACQLSFYRDPTVTVAGARLLVNVVGSDSASPVGGSGGAETRDREFILKANSVYMIRFSSQANTNRVSLCIEYYERNG